MSQSPKPDTQFSVFDGMGEEALHFRRRAAHCRELAKSARDEPTRRQLTDIADELEAEADRIDAEGNDPPMPMPPAR